MRGLGPFALMLIVSAALAGCTSSGENDNAAASSSAAPPAPEPTVTIETGSISGKVVDDEVRPVAGAAVALVETRHESKTDAAGAFTFNDLAPAKYSLIVQALGYETNAKKVEVVAGEVANVTLTLKSVLIANETYVRTYPKIILFHMGQSFTYTYTVPIVNQSNLNELFCSPCWHVIHMEKSPKQVMHEPEWPGDTTCPNVNCDTWIWYKSTWTNHWYSLEGEMPVAGYYDSRKSYLWSSNAVNMLKGKDKVLLAQGPSYYGSLEQKVTTHTSFAYNGEFPDGFTALPPPS